ncbi:MAG: energy-coupling factor transporter transmembrane protein EcfT [Lachnospiraceae bacterium]|nr:energy-coupling factor transporter transmembrane protein EcfT [Lachnospiraceae bacterium]
MKHLNPGYKLLSLMIASLLLSATFHVRLNLLITAVCLIVTFCTPGVNRKRLLLGLFPFFLAALGMFTAGLCFGAEGGTQGVEVTVFGQRTLYASNLTTAMQLSSRILAYGSLGMLYAFTSNAFELIMSLMQQFHLPPKFAYGILAAYHFFPVVREEYGIVGAALKVRGVKAGPISTKRLFPMLVQAMERSESLAMAMESRGFEEQVPRAVAFQVTLRWVDFAFLFGVNGLIIVGLIFV